MLPKPAIEQSEHNPESHSRNIRNPILHVCAAPKGGLDELYEAAKGTGSDKDGEQPEAQRACQRKGQRRKGNQMHNFVGAIRSWGG